MSAGQIPFEVTDWQNVTPTEHPGDAGRVLWRTCQFGDLRVRVVDVSPGYLAEAWCRKGHILYVLEGELETRFPDGTAVSLTAGMSYEVSDNLSAYRSYSRDGAKPFVVDGGFLGPDAANETPGDAP